MKPGSAWGTAVPASYRKVGQTLYEYGAVAERLPGAFPRLPIPKNDRPATISYPELAPSPGSIHGGFGSSRSNLGQNNQPRM